MNRTSANSALSYLTEEQSETFRDWMDVHKLDEQTLDRYLYVAIGFSETRLHPQPEINRSKFLNYELRQVWNLVAQAMDSFFPEKRKVLWEVRDHTELVINSADSPGRERSYTYHPEHDKNPTVSINFRNEPIDFLTVAHEFGHCVQLRATDDDFIPPMYREVGAFLGELVFLKYLATYVPELHVAIVDAWYRRNSYYLGKCSARLRKAKSSKLDSYKYEWNYPVARVFSCIAFDEIEGENMWALFSNLRLIVESMKEYMDSTKFIKKFGLMPPIHPAQGSLSSYRLLGVATLLAVCAVSRGASQYVIGIFYSKKRKMMEKDSIKVDLDFLLRPVSFTSVSICKKDNSLNQNLISYEAENVQKVSKYELDIYTSFGLVLELLSRSEYHEQQHLVGYIRKNIIPAIQCRQIKIYVDSTGIPVAFISWAKITDKVMREVHQIGRSLRNSEWNCGENIFFNDFIAPYGHSKQVVKDIRYNNIVPVGAIATSVRHNLDGSVRKINRWPRGKASSFNEYSECVEN